MRAHVNAGGEEASIRARLASLHPLALVVAATVLAAIPRATAPPTFGIKPTLDAMVTMRDGVKLGTDVYLPTIDGVVVSDKVPALLERTPYNKSGGAGTASYFVCRSVHFRQHARECESRVREIQSRIDQDSDRNAEANPQADGH
jgi:hypothetical protein